MSHQTPAPLQPGQLPPVVVENRALRDLADWAETLLCNAAPPSNATPVEWASIVARWQTQKHALRYDPNKGEKTEEFGLVTPE